MNLQLHADIFRRLINDFHFKEQSDWLRKGVCPDCQKKATHQCDPSLGVALWPPE